MLRWATPAEICVRIGLRFFRRIHPLDVNNFWCVVKAISFLLLSFFIVNNLLYAADEVVISSSRVSIPKREVGGSVTIINQREIEQSKAITISDVLRIVPGLSVSQSGGLGAITQIRLRGSEANHVLVLVDGIEANDPAGGSEFNFAHLSPSSIERIEVMRGPQSSIWGSDALAGVINIVTKKGQDVSLLTGSAEAGSNNTINSAVEVSGSVESLNYFFQGSFLDTDGVNVSEQGSEKDGYENNSLTFNSQYTVNESIMFGVNTKYIDATNEFDNASLGPPMDADNKTDVDQFYGKSFVNVSTFNNKWKHKLAISLTDTRNENTDTFGKSRTEGEKLKWDYLSEINFETDMISNEKHKFLFSVEKESERFKQRGLVSPFGDPNQTQDITNYGYSGEYRINLWDRMFLSTAVRKDDNDDFRNRETYRLTGSYLFPGLGTKLRASYGTGVKNPTFSELFGFFTGTFVGNPNLKPEKSEAWEFGIDQALLNDTAHFGMTLFWEDLKDEITTVFFPVNTAINLDGRSERNGVEIYFDSRLGSKASVRGSYTYVDSTQPDENGSQEREIRRPRNIASLIYNYEFIPERGNINLDVNYVDDQIDTDFSSFPFQEVKLDDYTLVNINASYQLNESVNMYARINNLLDDNYQDVFGFETLGQAFYAGFKVNL